MQTTEVKTIVSTSKGTLCLSFSPNPIDQGENTICGAYAAQAFSYVTKGVASHQDRQVSMGGTKMSCQIHFSPY